MHQRIDVFHARKIPVVRAPRNFEHWLDIAIALLFCSFEHDFHG
jgi:hypothetical protein